MTRSMSPLSTQKTRRRDLVPLPTRPRPKGGARGPGRGIQAALLLLGFLCSLGNPVFAQPSAFSSLDLPPEPVWQALQGARAVTGDELSSSLGNPACSARASGTSLAFSHLSWTGGLSREWVAAALPVSSIATVSIQAGVLRSDVLPGFDADGGTADPIRPLEWSAGAALGVALSRSWLLGLGGRALRLEDPRQSLTGVGFSTGLVWEGESRRLGLAVTDLGPAARTDAQRYPLPSRVRAGYEQEIGRGIVLAAVAWEADTHGRMDRLHLGLCLRPRPWLEFLSGVAAIGGEDAVAPWQWSVGTRIRQGGVAVSYAYLADQTLDSSYQLGLSLRGAEAR
jgi:hypothetical protein